MTHTAAVIEFLYDDGDEYENLLTQDEKMDIYAFTGIKIPPLARSWFTVLRNIHMEIDSLENNGDFFRHAAADSMKLVNNLKSILTNETTQSNLSTTYIAPFIEPFTTRNNKKSDDFTNNSIFWHMLDPIPWSQLN